MSRQASRPPLATRSPASRPLRGLAGTEILDRLEKALARCDGADGAHCIHELWMRGELPMNVESALARLWAAAAESVPEWLPMRYIDWLPVAYEVAGRFERSGRGESNLYLVLLDCSDSRAGPFGAYVGMSRYSPLERFDQHKAGIRAAGSVLRRGLEVLTGPTLHLQKMTRRQAEAVEEQFAESLRAEGVFVRGGH